MRWALWRFQRFNLARGDAACHARGQKLGHQAKSPAFVPAHRHQRSTQRGVRVGCWAPLGIHGPAFGNALTRCLGHGDFAQRDGCGGLVKLHGNAALPVRHGKRDGIGADHPGFSAGRRDDRRGIGHPDPDQARARDLPGEETQRRAGVRVAHHQLRGAVGPGGCDRGLQRALERGLRKPHLPIDLNNAGARLRDNRFGRAVHPARS